MASLPSLDAALPARAHRGGENRLHWVLDVLFHDGPMRPRTGNAPGDILKIKHMAMNPIRNAGGKESLKLRRKTAAWNHRHLKEIITRTAQ